MLFRELKEWAKWDNDGMKQNVNMYIHVNVLLYTWVKIFTDLHTRLNDKYLLLLKTTFYNTCLSVQQYETIKYSRTFSTGIKHKFIVENSILLCWASNNRPFLWQNVGIYPLKYFPPVIPFSLFQHSWYRVKVSGIKAYPR